VTNGAAEHSLTYDYDNSGRLASVTSPAGTFSYTYTPGSSLIASVTGPAHTVTNTWEPNRDVLDVKENRIPSTTTPISRFDYGVNSIGQRTGVETSGTAFPSQPADWTWAYDALGQVISADSPKNDNDRAYEYDQIGNRRKSADGALVTTGFSATIYDATNLNQYSQISVPSVQSVVPIHDQDGNATGYPLPVDPTANATLAYDGENRLISVTTGTTSVSYIYDSQSRRIARTEFPLPLGEGQGEGAQHTLYLYDDWNCLAEYALQNSSFNLHTSLSWGLDLSDSLQGAGGVGGLLAITKYQAQSTTHYFPTFDGNGNVSEYLTASGAIAAHYEYDPFGRITVVTGPNAGTFAYRFSTKPRDAATGLYYYGYRWYDPYTGRWINRDPIEESGGVNLYGFVGNEASGRIDWLGLQAKISRITIGAKETKVTITLPFGAYFAGDAINHKSYKEFVSGKDDETLKRMGPDALKFAYEAYVRNEKNRAQFDADAFVAGAPTQFENWERKCPCRTYSFNVTMTMRKSKQDALANGEYWVELNHSREYLGQADDFQGTGLFMSLAQGGHKDDTLAHETGHLLGLLHPHPKNMTPKGRANILDTFKSMSPESLDELLASDSASGGKFRNALIFPGYDWGNTLRFDASTNSMAYGVQNGELVCDQLDRIYDLLVKQLQ
jgi:RHS repeat-associated protein